MLNQQVLPDRLTRRQRIATHSLQAYQSVRQDPRYQMNTVGDQLGEAFSQIGIVIEEKPGYLLQVVS